MAFTDETEVPYKVADRFYYGVAGISFLLFMSSFFFETISTDTTKVNGLDATLFGVFYFPASWANASWLANPMILFCWIALLNTKKTAFIWALLALVLASFCLLFQTIVIRDSSAKPFTLHIGFWLWFGSLAIAVMGSLYIVLEEKKQTI